MKACRILLVEDNPDDEQLTLRALRKLPSRLDVTIARDGQEALDKLHSPDYPSPDLILLDLKLPKLSGLDVLKRIREHPKTAHVVVVVLTSSDEPSDILSSYREYVNSYIRKPVEFEEFGSVVNRLGTYWLDTNLPPPHRT
jgi:two-component system, response regulator